MTKKSEKRGGSDTAREAGLVGIVVHVTPEERQLLGAAAELAGLSSRKGGVKEFLRQAGLAEARNSLKKMTKIH